MGFSKREMKELKRKELQLINAEETISMLQTKIKQKFTNYGFESNISDAFKSARHKIKNTNLVDDYTSPPL